MRIQLSVLILSMILVSCYENSPVPVKTYKLAEGVERPFSITQQDYMGATPREIYNPDIHFTPHDIVEMPSTARVISTSESQEDVEIELYPTGDERRDWSNLQILASVTGIRGQNATIYLKATNEAGTPTPFMLPTAYISEDLGFGVSKRVRGVVNIFGENAGHSGRLAFIGETVGDAMTTIDGGVAYDPFGGEIRLESSAFQILGRDDVTFSNIHFTGNAGIFSGWNNEAVTNLTIENCMFSEMFGSGFIVMGSKGLVNISNNVFINLGWEVLFQENFNEVVFSNNEIRSVGSYGLFLYNTSGEFDISNNIIDVRVGDFIFQSTTAIYVSNLGEATVRITDNDFITDDVGLAMNDASGPQVYPVIFSGNEINIVDSQPWAIGIYIHLFENTLSNLCVYDNVISGSGYWAIEVSSLATFFPDEAWLSPGVLEEITFVNNDYSGFTALCSGDYDLNQISLSSCPLVYFDPTTRNIQLCGYASTVADHGTNNKINDGECTGSCE